MRRLAMGLLLTTGLAAVLPSITLAAPVPCRVRNLDQGTGGGSLKAMAGAADDGDRLRVRGVCRGEVVISDDITIRGIGGAAVTGQHARRAVRIQPGADVTIRDLVIRDGHAPPATPMRGGGGIRNRGTLTLRGVTVRDNRAGTDGLGGGILNLGELTVVGSTIRGNVASRGGGINTRSADGAVDLSVLRVRDSVLRRNRAVDGGGLHNLGVTTMVDSVVTRNVADFGGGGIANVATGSFDVTGTSITRNTAGQEGGGIVNYDGAALVLGGGNTLTDNTPDDCFGSPAC